MPTIAELLAAKQAKAAGSAGPRQPAVPQSGGAAATAGKKSGLTISEPEEETTLPAFLKPREPRSLSGTSGEDIPMTPVNAPADVIAWHSALQGFDADLCLMHDPDPTTERAWIAVRRSDRPEEPIFLFPLPLYPHPKPIRRPDEPF